MENTIEIVTKTRGNIVESIFKGCIVITDSTGNIIKFFGSPDYFTFIRSASKPFQSIPLITTGAFDSFGLNSKHLAITSGSHNGQKIHQKTVLEILKKAGFSEENLQCGVHLPFTKKARKEIGENYRPLSNTCSGKHAGMLLICKHMGWDIKNYTDKNHPVQQLMRETVAKITDMKSEELAIGIDGCGVPVFGMPIKNMATGFARLLNPENSPQKFREPIKKIVKAIQENPVIYAGEDRIATAFVQDNPDNIFKAGSEGVGCFAVGKYGLTFKLECGESGEIFAFVTAHIAKLLGCKTDRLSRFLNLGIKANNGTITGQTKFMINSLQI
jgi:L-asparaginase II